MPGILFSTFDKNKNEAARNCLYSGEHFYQEELLHTPDFELGQNTYNTYPTNSFQTEKYQVFLEGIMYNTEIETIHQELFSFIQKSDFKAIQKLLSQIDGEFVITYYDKSDFSIYILNDTWGRLPMYYLKNEEGIVITREIRFIQHFVDLKDVNRLSMAHQLLFGYTLGEHTLWEDIKRVQPSSVLHVQASKNRISIHSEFQSIQLSGGSNDARLLRSKIDIAIENRIQKLNNPALSLSGGLDSRLIASIMKDNNCLIPFITYTHEGITNELDVEIGIEVADRLQNSYQHYVISTGASNKSLEELNSIKGGMNYLGMNFILPYHKWHFKNKFSVITGDGGDKFLVNLTPPTKISSQREFSKALLKYNGKLSLKQVASITSLNENEIIDSILSHVEGYKVKSWQNKYEQFILRERGINWLFEGEDRSRYFGWITSPYYSPDVIKESVKISEEVKENGKLFLKLFRQLPGRMDELENPNWRCAIADQKAVKRLMFKQKMKGLLPEKLNTQIQKNSIYDFEHHQELIKILENRSILFDLNTLKLEKLQNVVWWNIYSIFKAISKNEPKSIRSVSE